ncbi:hypothetical protein [Scytonema sp. NUACC26]|uniref:hypothetical protein n=1 Tax=Scytonema sp. NUACC26 TaxID=3140176 RepID=UPI0034DCAE4E
MIEKLKEIVIKTHSIYGELGLGFWGVVETSVYKNEDEQWATTHFNDTAYIAEVPPSTIYEYDFRTKQWSEMGNDES